MTISLTIQTRDQVETALARKQIDDVKIYAREKGLIVFENWIQNSPLENDVTSTQSARIERNFQIVVAAYERTRAIGRLKRGQLLAVEDGKYIYGGLLPFGYARSRGRTAKMLSCASAIETIFSEACKGNSFSQIANVLTEGNFSPPFRSHSGWTARTVARIVRNPIYKGVVSLPGDESFCRVNEDLRFVTDEVWQAAQR